MFPRLVAAYQAAEGAQDVPLLATAVAAGRTHFAALCRRLLEMDESAIEAYVAQDNPRAATEL